MIGVDDGGHFLNTLSTLALGPERKANPGKAGLFSHRSEALGVLDTLSLSSAHIHWGLHSLRVSSASTTRKKEENEKPHQQPLDT